MHKPLRFAKKSLIFATMLFVCLLHTACFQSSVQNTNFTDVVEEKTKTEEDTMPKRVYPVIPDTALVYIYLNFDDGPNNGTPNLLRVLSRHKTPASLFLVGAHVYGTKFQKTFFGMYSKFDWLELCNHSFTHANHKYKTYYTNPDAVVADFQRCQDSLKFTNRIGRAPGLNMWSIQGDSSRFRTKTECAEKLCAAGFQMIGWDLDWDFKNYKNHQEMLKRLVEVEKNRYPLQYPAHYQNHLVMLLHDQSFTDSLNCKELEKFIEVINNMPEKYCFRKISDYPLLKNKNNNAVVQ